MDDRRGSADASRPTYSRRVVDGTAGEPLVSVVVPVRDGASDLPPLLAGLAAQEGVASFEVLVVDNGSRDATAEVAGAHDIVTRVIRERRPGSYSARNAGLAQARSPIVAFTDADCIPEPGWLAAGLEALADADLAGGAIEQVRSSEPTWWEIYDRATYLDQERLVLDQRFAATANLFVRRSVFDQVGPFDSRLRSSGDLELCQRAVDAGFRLVYAPEARVLHRPRRTLRGTWNLHRRLGAGWADLARLGVRPRAWRDRAMLIPLSWVAHAVAERGDPLRRRQLVIVHGTVTMARWVGRASAALRRSAVWDDPAALR